MDMDAVIAAAARTGTILEINAQPDRLDLNDVHVRRAIEAGVKMAIDSDAHNAGDLRFPKEFGIAVARRGWATKHDIVNTLGVERLLAMMKPRAAVKAAPRRVGGARRRTRRLAAHA
jgi:DNA polymerase (family 10)